MNEGTAVFIPARLGATRLPNKPLADIAGKPMVIHVALRAKLAKIGPVFIATGDQEIAKIAGDYGIEAILTHKPHETGSDRVFEAVRTMEHETGCQYKYIMNLQGDLPNIDIDSLQYVLKVIQDSKSDIATLASRVENVTQKNNENIVKLIATASADLAHEHLKSLYFTRAAAPYGTAEFYEHIGIYIYTRPALEKFVHLPMSKLEKLERLEQLRALEAGMTIAAGLVPCAPIGVDTPADLELVRSLLKNTL